MKQTLMEYRGYYGSVEFDLEDKCLVGTVQFVEGTISYDGENLTELEHGFHAAIDSYVETCKQRGISPVLSFSGTFQIRPGPELHRAAAIAARKEGFSLNEWVRQAMGTQLQQRERQQAAELQLAVMKRFAAMEIKAYFERASVAAAARSILRFEPTHDYISLESFDIFEPRPLQTLAPLPLLYAKGSQI